MQSSTTAWQQDWTIDPDPLAAAQARHRPSGFGVSLKTLGMVQVRPGERPFLTAIYTDDSRGVIDRLFVELGNRGCRDWIKEKQSQARELWCALGLDLDPSAELPEAPPCEVTCWRGQWTVQRHEGLGQVDVTHASGWAGRFVYTEAGEDGRMGWCATVPDEWTARFAEAEASLDAAAQARLQQEAEILLMEERYFHCSAKRLARPFDDAWRTLWHVKEKDGEQWLVHASGLAVTPVHGAVDEDPTHMAWMLQLQSGDVYDLDREMRQRVGQKAWDRVHEQGWHLCVEMGYVAPLNSMVH
ncbi:MAG TPA: hypothetical protein VN201_00980 [Roseateles sp.]|nr:hypothetical protein [Roseateles sp.]